MIAEEERVIETAENLIDLIRGRTPSSYTQSRGQSMVAAVVGLEHAIEKYRKAIAGRKKDTPTPREYPLLALYRAARGIAGNAGKRGVGERPPDKWVAKWATNVILTAMDYYDSEVADCGDDECPVCQSMQALGLALGHLVIFPANKYKSEYTWRKALKARLANIRGAA